MVNILEFIYSELKLVDGLKDYIINDKLFYGKSPIKTKGPLLIYKEISPAKIDFKGKRNEFMQISVWGKDGLEIENIKQLLVKHFHMLKKSPVKNVSVRAINNTFDKETNMFGKHLTIHILLQDSF